MRSPRSTRVRSCRKACTGISSSAVTPSRWRWSMKRGSDRAAQVPRMGSRRSLRSMDTPRTCAS
ncbi:Uncharacterised protein [Bordetella pertussis]|nr:Uncharacterised protein [Bordetella pertussis]CFP62641.1 Uncharacterised protein [Bordetella pertussis]